MPAVQGEPLPVLRPTAGRSPIWRTTLPDKRTAWLVTRYEDVARVLKDGTFAKDRLNTMYSEQLTKTPWIPGFLKPLERNMLVHRWSSRVVSVSSGRDMLRALPAVLAFTRCLRKLIERQHAEPEDDLITALVRAEIERIGGEVTRFRGGIR